MRKLEFFRLLDNNLLNNFWGKIKITKGHGRHICFLCDSWLQKRKMKLYGTENGKMKNHMLCFGCWGEFKEWQKIEGQVKPIATKNSITKIPVNRWRF